MLDDDEGATVIPRATNYLVLSALAGAAASCAVEPEHLVEPVRSVLGHGFGSVVVVEAEAFVNRPSKGYETGVLSVARVDGHATSTDLRIPWTYGGWSAERAEPAGLDGFRLERGRSYRLWGYETGQWIGVPPDLGEFINRVSEPKGDDFGWMGPQTWGLHFRSTFRVLTGEAL